MASTLDRSVFDLKNPCVASVADPEPPLFESPVPFVAGVDAAFTPEVDAEVARILEGRS